MPRTLPWVTSDSNRKKGKQRQSTPQLYDNRRVAASEKKDLLRSSQTPPSSPIEECPRDEFLIEGLENDDMYIMVEDEFYAVAQTFTKHLHYAEYVRRSKEAKSRNAAAVNDLEQHADGKTPMKTEQEKRKASSTRQNPALRGTIGTPQQPDSGQEDEENGEDNEDDHMWAGTHLHGLIMSPSKGRSLVGLQGIQSKARTGEGYGQHRQVDKSIARTRPLTQFQTALREGGLDAEEVAASDDDDLDVQSSSIVKKAAKLPEKPKALPTKNHAKHSSDSTASNKNNAMCEKRPIDAEYNQPARYKLKKISIIDDLDALPDDVNHKLKSSPDLQENATKAKRSRVNEVPMFLV